MSRFKRWLRTSEGQTVIDDAVLGCLMAADVQELCSDFGISEVGVWDAISAAISEGF